MIRYYGRMESQVQQEIWSTIRTNMGDNSLELFKKFHVSEPLKIQFEAVVELFKYVFGLVKANELLEPLRRKVEKDTR